MSLNGITHVLPILFMINAWLSTAEISTSCTPRPCYGTMCAMGCTTPTKVRNMIPTGNCPTYPVGTLIVYVCAHNHKHRETLNCMTNGKWSKPKKNCQRLQNLNLPRGPQPLHAPENPQGVVSSRRIAPPKVIQTKQTSHKKSTPSVTTNGTISTPAVSTADGELTSLILASDDLNLSKSQTPTTSTNRDLTTEKISDVHQLQTTEFQKYASEFNETGIGNHTRELMEALNSEKSTSSTVTIALSTIVGVIVFIILIVALIIIKLSKNKRTHGRNRIPTSEPTDLKNTEGRDDLVPYSMEVT